MSLFIVISVFLIPVSAAVAIVSVMNRRHKKFINPLTKSLRRPPGAQLGRELGAEQFELGFSLIEMLLPGIVPLFVYMQNIANPANARGSTTLMIAIVIWVLWVAYAGMKLARRIKRIRTLRLGYECELAVGQELDLLMLSGFRVFHDIPAENFNIDHIVIGAPGVFAVETKGRSKVISSDRDAKKQFRVSYQKGVLQFPNGSDKDAVAQAERQATWVRQWLSQSTGQPVAVKPVIVLPGWFVEIKDSPSVPVIASGYIQGYFLGQKGVALTPKEITQICYQIDQKVRDLPPGEIVRPLPTQ